MIDIPKPCHITRGRGEWHIASKGRAKRTRKRFIKKGMMITCHIKDINWIIESPSTKLLSFSALILVQVFGQRATWKNIKTC